MQLHIACARGEDLDPERPGKEPDAIDIMSDRSTKSSKLDADQRSQKRSKREKS